jgi:RNA polymerase sigma factor (sigma-70 family)
LSNSREHADEPTVWDFNGLIAAVAEQRDRAAFRQIFEHFAPRLLGFLQKQGSQPQVAEEVVQETMVNVWRKAGQFDPAKAAASTWIFTIARNARIDHLRKTNRPAIDENDPALVPEPEPAAHDVMSRRQETHRLMKVVGELPADQREVLQLAFFQEKAHGEVAKELGIPLGTVKSRIRLALKKIRSELGES